VKDAFIGQHLMKPPDQTGFGRTVVIVSIVRSFISFPNDEQLRTISLTLEAFKNEMHFLTPHFFGDREYSSA